MLFNLEFNGVKRVRVTSLCLKYLKKFLSNYSGGLYTCNINVSDESLMFFIYMLLWLSFKEDLFQNYNNSQK